MLRVSDFKLVIERVIYVPHPEVKVGKVYCTGSVGDSVNLSVSPKCVLDITGDIYIGKYVMIASGVKILTHSHDIKGKEPLLLKQSANPLEFTTVTDKIIGDDVWIFESLILSGCSKIARGVIIGAGSVVTKDILEEYSIWAGNPAKKIGIR